ncbi:MAG: hypothetical protein H0X42_07350 [Solirubrobacterales bacterium]|nr:hypothetical protein [Solirubrobacterales bacterium]
MRRTLLAALSTFALFAAVASPAQAAFGLNNFEFSLEDQAGLPVTQAGSHPFAVRNGFGFNYTGTGFNASPDAQPRNIEIRLPTGFAGNPSAVPTCARAEFLSLDPEFGSARCPNDTAVGVANVETQEPGTPAPRAVYNLPNPSGTVAELGFVVQREPVTIDFYVDQSPPYGVIAKTTNVSQAVELYGSELVIWGDPADSAHDAERGSCVIEGGECPVDLGEISFVTLPRACTGPLFTTYSALSWQGDEDYGSSSTPVTADGCDEVGFDPKVGAQPSTALAESPSGLSLEVNVDDPELTNPSETARADSDIKAINLTFPKGVTINPSTSEGQVSCDSAQLAAEALIGQSCPEASKVGTLGVETPLLRGEVLDGSVYLAPQRENPFGTLVALYVVIKDPDLGVLIKLPVKVSLDPSTGQISTSVDQLPQLPFSHLRLHLRTGPKAPLATPRRCGTYQTHFELVPWSDGAPALGDTPMTIDRGCDTGGFAPGLNAGSATNVAGAFSSFILNVTRESGEQNVTGLEVNLPPGLLAKLGGVPLCGEVQAATGACPPGSQIGTTQVAAGPGPAPLSIPQPGKDPTGVYLAGPYEGAPFSTVVKVPAQAGPFDLGTVAVRAGLFVDSTTSQVTVKTDPLPQILEGIPVTYRVIHVDVNRPNFTVNPTNCEPLVTRSTIGGSEGAVARPSDKFQVGGCAALAFKPKLKLRLKGSTQRGKNPALKAVLTQPLGQANISRAAVVLPKSEFIDNRHINNPCTRVQFNAGAGNGAGCPASSILGKATAYTPLLDKPLTGPVYFRSNGGERELPDLVASLDGQIHVNLVGFIDSVHKKGSEVSRTRTTFATVPDAPVSRFVLQLKGNKHGLLQNSANLCKVSNKATIKMLAQNGRTHDYEHEVANSCKGKKKQNGKKHKHHGKAAHNKKGKKHR